MCTTDQWRIAQRPLAEFSYELKKKYNQTFGTSYESFMNLYDLGEVQLSSVFENLLVATRNRLNKPTRKVAGDRYDFVRVDSIGRETPLGDMKTGVLQKDDSVSIKRRYVIGSVENKLGKIYIVGWNWITNKPNFFCIPPDEFDKHPKAGYKIPVNPRTGERSGGWYNDNCAYNTWEDMCIA
jgi:hypothetical protein